jgi:hypothetical protein
VVEFATKECSCVQSAEGFDFKGISRFRAFPAGVYQWVFSVVFTTF